MNYMFLLFLIPKNDDLFINACKGTKKISKCKADFAKLC